MPQEDEPLKTEDSLDVRIARGKSCSACASAAPESAGETVDAGQQSELVRGAPGFDLVSAIA